MSWLVTAKQYIPAVIGEEFGGGYFAGYISHTADGNPTHALIVAPKASGGSGTLSGLSYGFTPNLQWKTTQTSTANATSSFDGVLNTSAMVEAGIADHPAAEFCVNLNIGGYTDWYLPAPLENEIAYFNLKPSTTANVTNRGVNAYAVPQRNSNYTTAYPSQTSLSTWQATSGSEFFLAGNHWSSRQTVTSTGDTFVFSTGNLGQANKDLLILATRAFRRIAL